MRRAEETESQAEVASDSLGSGNSPDSGDLLAVGSLPGGGNSLDGVVTCQVQLIYWRLATQRVATLTHHWSEQQEQSRVSVRQGAAQWWEVAIHQIEKRLDWKPGTQDGEAGHGNSPDQDSLGCKETQPEKSSSNCGGS